MRIFLRKKSFGWRIYLINMENEENYEKFQEKLMVVVKKVLKIQKDFMNL
jgi:hypothetical protein